MTSSTVPDWTRSTIVWRPFLDSFHSVSLGPLANLTRGTDSGTSPSKQ